MLEIVADGRGDVVLRRAFRRLHAIQVSLDEFPANLVREPYRRKGALRNSPFVGGTMVRSRALIGLSTPLASTRSCRPPDSMSPDWVRAPRLHLLERKSVDEGKGVSVLVDPGWCRNIKNKKT